MVGDGRAEEEVELMQVTGVGWPYVAGDPDTGHGVHEGGSNWLARGGSSRCLQ